MSGDVFRLSLALGPLAVYFAIFGVINLRRTPFVTTGARDTAALALAVSGLVIVGPIELFMPEGAMINFGPYALGLALAFYGLTMTLLILLQKPRLTVYNISPVEFRPILVEVVGRLDPHARWAGNSLVLPDLQIELHVDTFAPMRNITLVAVGDQQSFAGWRRLESHLSAALAKMEVARNPIGAGMVIVGLAMVSAMIVQLAGNADEVVQALREMLRLPQ